MLLETVEDNGLCAIEKPANSGEEKTGKQQGQTKLGSAAAQMARRRKTPCADFTEAALRLRFIRKGLVSNHNLSWVFSSMDSETFK